MKKKKRSQEKRITRQATVLRWMRMSHKISMRAAGRLLGLSDSSISHYEQGRMDLNRPLIELIVTSYGFSMKEFDEYANGKPLPLLSIRDECYSMIDRLDEAKLRTVHMVLLSYTPNPVIDSRQ